MSVWDFDCVLGVSQRLKEVFIRVNKCVQSVTQVVLSYLFTILEKKMSAFYTQLQQSNQSNHSFWQFLHKLTEASPDDVRDNAGVMWGWVSWA